MGEMDSIVAGQKEVAGGVRFEKFFLATDDPQVERTLRHRYGEKLVVAPKRSLDRNAEEGIQDAFVDLLTLAGGTEIIGSFKSSFSSVAALFNLVPFRVLDV